MAYVPPHLRNKRNDAAGSAPRSLESFQAAKRTTAPTEPSYTLDEISAMLGCDKSDLSTLTVTNTESSDPALSDSSERNLDKDSLRAVILFEGQHPEWQTEHRILCKSNLHVLHRLAGDHEVREKEDPSDLQPIDDAEIEYPLFQEIPFMKKKFEFSGWWRIQNIRFLAPLSTELLDLFEKKFNMRGGRSHYTPFSMQRGKSKTRTEEAWRDSLNREWAVVTLARNHERKDRPELPELPAKQHLTAEHPLSEISPDSEGGTANTEVQVMDG